MLLVLGLGACSEDGTEEVGGSFPSLAPGDAESSAPSGDAAALDPAVTAGSETCELVRAGIDAFNEGDFEETVERFEEALSAAEEATSGPDASPESLLLLDAVRYYAELEPEDYATAPDTADFETNKQITLGLCVTQEEPLAPPSSGGPDGPGVEA